MTTDLRLSLLKWGKDNAKKQGREQKREFPREQQRILPRSLFGQDGKDIKKQPF